MIKQEINLESTNKEELIALLKENRKTIEAQNVLINDYKNKFKNLEDHISILLRQIFGKKSERYVSNSTPVILNSLFDLETPQPQEEKKEVEKIESYNRKKKSANKQKGRNPWPSHLPIRENIIEPSDKMDTDIELQPEITQILEMSSPMMWVEKIIRKKYIDTATGKIKIAELPSRPINKSSFGTSIIGNAMVAKFVDHMPIHRFVEKVKRDHNVSISRSSLGESIHQNIELLVPLYNLHVEQILSASYLQGDETHQKTQAEGINGKCHLGYIYVCRNPVANTVFFSYQSTRSQQNTRWHLQNFKGKLQTDGHNVYEQFDQDPNIEHFACWAHARRYFHKAQESDPDRANKIMDLIRILYEVEEESRERSLDYDQRKSLRLKKSQMVLTQIKELLEQYSLQIIMPDSRMGKAISYTLKRWDNLIRYIYHGEVEIDNNLIENSIRPIALGRKNFMFAGNEKSAQHTAIMYSFFGTCKLHNVDPYTWLHYVLSRIADTPITQLDDLLPQNWHKLNL